MTDTNPEARATVAARLAREHTEAGHEWCYELAVAEYCIGLPVHEAELFISALDLRDAVQVELDGVSGFRATGDATSFDLGGAA